VHGAPLQWLHGATVARSHMVRSFALADKALASFRLAPCSAYLLADGKRHRGRLHIPLRNSNFAAPYFLTTLAGVATTPGLSMVGVGYARTCASETGLRDWSEKNSCLNSGSGWEDRNRVEAAPQADHATYRKTNSNPEPTKKQRTPHARVSHRARSPFKDFWRS
jgi:hypothetical protein